MSEKNYHNRDISRQKWEKIATELHHLTTIISITDFQENTIYQVRPSLLGGRNILTTRMSKTAHSVTALF
jgi:hypothetical protein